MKTLEQLQNDYDKACAAYEKARYGTQAAAKAGQRMERAAMALDAYRVHQKRNNGETISVFESLFV